MGQFLRIVLLAFLFLFVYRIIKKFLKRFFIQKNKPSSHEFEPNQQNRKAYENIEEAKYIEIKDDANSESKSEKTNS